MISDRTPARSLLRSLRATLGPRGRAWLLIPASALADALLALAAAGLEPKHVRILSGPQTPVLLTASPARPGGLVVEIVPMC